MKRIYLDHSATTPIDVEVFAAMEPFLCDQFGNPSSLHRHGREAKVAIEDAREVMKGIGGRVVVIPYMPTQSSTNIKQRIYFS